jgi:transcriptional regulator with XRE-family HTH domain
MLSIGGYIKLILKKRGLTVADLAKMMTEQEKKHGSSATIYRMNLNPELKYDKITVEKARKIEIALNLPKFQLVNMVNRNLTKRQVEMLENLYK